MLREVRALWKQFWLRKSVGGVTWAGGEVVVKP